MAARKSDDLLVVVKFICKKKVLRGSWIQSERWEDPVPIEVHLLASLSHPNIVQLVEVCENPDYYQLVMERHGSGMDLFEFIDREPKMDEPLTSYIFRQLVSALTYLQANGIVHRDCKDENVIINESFSVKLIDFGSAAYYSPGGPAFSTFVGTLEYAAPEILLGNRYRGPEAEMWSLGVLLFTLVFGEAPFQTPEETMEGSMILPWEVSGGLEHLLSWILHPSPESRASMGQAERHWWTLQPVEPKEYDFKTVLPSAMPQEIHPAKFAQSQAFVVLSEETSSE